MNIKSIVAVAWAELQAGGLRALAKRSLRTIRYIAWKRRDNFRYVLISLWPWLFRFFPAKNSLARLLADADRAESLALPNRRFSAGQRPVIRWCKGDGLDDDVTRSAIAQATRIFGKEVDYCLCTNNIDPARARSLLAWACEPVEWWPALPEDNPGLARLLADVGCVPEHYGYWWKWFPFRTRPEAPEWILDGDMVITARPPWFDAWKQGTDVVRLTQENWNPNAYGNYSDLVDSKLALNSGLASLPPNDRLGEKVLAILAWRPLQSGHDGRYHMCEQGVIAAAFQRMQVEPIPLRDFPFAAAYATSVDRGPGGLPGEEWGFHFIRSFVRPNALFDQLVADGTVIRTKGSPPASEFVWLGGQGQWGVPGWSMPDSVADIVTSAAREFAGRPVLEIGTSRGRLSAMLASVGCHVTTVDHQDRGAAQNLAGLSVDVVVADALAYLRTTEKVFDLIVVDLHGNSVSAWMELSGALLRPLAQDGTIVVSNTQLYKQWVWREERGVRWFVDQLAPTWDVTEFDVHPGVAVLSRI